MHHQDYSGDQLVTRPSVVVADAIDQVSCPWSRTNCAFDRCGRENDDRSTGVKVPVCKFQYLVSPPEGRAGHAIACR